MALLQSKRVILFGIGGVGSWCAECLIRTGLTHLTIVDGDVVQPSNINRQLPATQATIGRPKVEVLKERLLAINPEAEIVTIFEHYHAEGKTESGADLKIGDYDYVIDAIDSVTAKTDLILYATHVRRIKIFSSMGAALRFDPTKVTTGELMAIKGDALAKGVRARMKRMGLKPYRKVKCVYSMEQAMRLQSTDRSADGVQTEQAVKGSLMQVTAVFGCTLASMVIEDIREKIA